MSLVTVDPYLTLDLPTMACGLMLYLETGLSIVVYFMTSTPRQMGSQLTKSRYVSQTCAGNAKGHQQVRRSWNCPYRR